MGLHLERLQFFNATAVQYNARLHHRIWARKWARGQQREQDDATRAAPVQAPKRAWRPGIDALGEDEAAQAAEEAPCAESRGGVQVEVQIEADMEAEWRGTRRLQAARAILALAAKGALREAMELREARGEARGETRGEPEVS